MSRKEEKKKGRWRKNERNQNEKIF